MTILRLPKLARLRLPLFATLIVAFSLTGCAASTRSGLDRDLQSAQSTYSRPIGSDDARSQTEDTIFTDSLNLYHALEYAAQHNPGVEAAFNRWKASAERISQAKSLPDPRLNFGEYFREVETRVGPQQQSVGLSQMFPWFGTLRLKGAIATQEALIAQQQFEAARDRLYYEVTSAFAEYYYLNQSTQITQDLLDLTRSAERVAQAKYRAAVGPYADVIRAQTELGRLEDQLLALNAKTQPAIARLNAVLNRPSQAPVAPPSTIPAETLALTDSALLARATQVNPSLRALDLAVQKEDDAISLAKRKFYPSFAFGLDYISTGDARMPGVVDSGKDPIIGRFSINIPIWRGAYSAGRREAEARRRAAQLERRDQENHLEARMQSVLFDFHDAERKIDLYHDALVPKAQQSISASMQGYEAGEVDFLDLLDAQRMLLQFELAERRARADRLIRMAELRMLVGDAYNNAETQGQQ